MNRLTAGVFSIIVSLSQAWASSVPHYECPEKGRLTPDMVRFYHENGYLVLDGYLSAEQCDDLIAESHAIIDRFELTPETKEIFSGEQTAGMDSKRSKFFLDSADKVVCLMERDAFDDNGELKVSKIEAVNKIAHALGEQNEKFRAVTMTDRLKTLIESLGIFDPLLVQSMLICKPKRIGGELSAHQDSTFLHSFPDTTTAFWIPLMDATEENGCLYVAPGSHKKDVLFRYVRDSQDKLYFIESTFYNQMQEEGVDAYALEDRELNQLKALWKDYKFQLVPMKKGSIIFFPGSMVHGSCANRSAKPRPAYTGHVISSNSCFALLNWLQREEFQKIKSDTDQ